MDFSVNYLIYIDCYVFIYIVNIFFFNLFINFIVFLFDVFFDFYFLEILDVISNLIFDNLVNGFFDVFMCYFGIKFKEFYLGSDIIYMWLVFMNYL